MIKNDSVKEDFLTPTTIAMTENTSPTSPKDVDNSFLEEPKMGLFGLEEDMIGRELEKVWNVGTDDELREDVNYESSFQVMSDSGIQIRQGGGEFRVSEKLLAKKKMDRKREEVYDENYLDPPPKLDYEDCHVAYGIANSAIIDSNNNNHPLQPKGGVGSMSSDSYTGRNHQGINSPAAGNRQHQQGIGINFMGQRDNMNLFQAVGANIIPSVGGHSQEGVKHTDSFFQGVRTEGVPSVPPGFENDSSFLSGGTLGPDLNKILALRVVNRPDREEDRNIMPMLRLRGLPYRATQGDVHEFFGRHAANFRMYEPIQLILNRDGRPSGMALVSFQSIGAARDAQVELDKKGMGHRYVEVFGPLSQSSDGRNVGKQLELMGGGNHSPVNPQAERKVLDEVRAIMQFKCGSRVFLSMLGLMLSDQARHSLRVGGIGLKTFMEKYEPEFRVEGERGAEQVLWNPDQMNNSNQIVAGLRSKSFHSESSSPNTPLNWSSSGINPSSVNTSSSFFDQYGSSGSIGAIKEVPCSPHSRNPMETVQGHIVNLSNQLANVAIDKTLDAGQKDILTKRLLSEISMASNSGTAARKGANEGKNRVNDMHVAAQHTPMHAAQHTPMHTAQHTPMRMHQTPGYNTYSVGSNPGSPSSFLDANHGSPLHTHPQPPSFFQNINVKRGHFGNPWLSNEGQWYEHFPQSQAQSQEKGYHGFYLPSKGGGMDKGGFDNGSGYLKGKRAD